jgi:radial spoke head protein 1
VYTYPNGDVYDGQWQNGLRHGTGKYSYKEDGGV